MLFNTASKLLPGLSDQRPSLIKAHGLLFGSFLPNVALAVLSVQGLCVSWRSASLVLLVIT